MDDLIIDSRTTIPGDELSWTAVRASGAGGQNVNKVATKVDLRFHLAGSQALRSEVKARLRRLARGKLDAAGNVVVVSQRYRQQPRNLADARDKLAELIKQALVRPKPRRATKPSRGSQRRRLDSKRRVADKKRTRSKVDYDS